MKESGILYDARKAETQNLLFRIDRLQEQGFQLGDLPQEAFYMYKELVEKEVDEKLAGLREEIAEMLM